MCGRLHRPERDRGLVERNAKRRRRADGRERRGDEVPARERQPHLGLVIGVPRDEAQARQTQSDDIRRPKRRVLGFAEKRDPRLCPRRERANARIVGVEQRQAIGGEGLDELGLSRGNGVDARRSREMHGHLGDRRDDPDARTDQLRQVCDLARNVEADLDNGDLVTGLDPEKRHRNADLVVEGSRAAQHAVSSAKRRGGRFLRRGLADVAGDADRGYGIRVAQGVGQTPQRALRVGHLDDNGVGGEIGDGVFHDRSPRATGERIRDERMPVATVAEREEHASRRRDARVERAASEALIRSGIAVDDPSTRRAEHLLQGEHVRVEWYRASGSIRLHARVTQRIPGDGPEGAHRGHGAGQLRLRALEHDDDDHAGVLRGDHPRE